jgi:L-iditol 2-dehydrogenase
MSIIGNPQTLFPMGHELVGKISRVGKDVKSLSIGDRVVFLPAPSCESFGFQLCPGCINGNLESCYVIAGVGDGTDREKQLGGRGSFGGFGGGGYCEYVIGFEKQFFKVPDDVSDEAAVLAEPFSVALHAVVRNLPEDSDSVIVSGAGTIGLMVIAAIRALDSKCRIISIARYPFQAEASRKLGADKVITTHDKISLYENVAKITGGRLFKPLIGKPGVFGNAGPDKIFDCVATEDSLDDALHLVRSNGKIIILGQGYSVTKKVDWSILVLKEIDIAGSVIYGMERYRGKTLHCFELALMIMKKNPAIFEGLLTHKYNVGDYRTAFEQVRNKGKNGVIKAAFDFR